MTASSRQTGLKTGKHAWRSSSSSVVVVILVVNSSEIQHDDADDELLRTNHSSTQPSIPPGSVNEYQLRLGKQRQVWFIPLANETQGVQVKLCYPLTTRAITERLRDVSCGGAIQIYFLLLVAHLWRVDFEVHVARVGNSANDDDARVLAGVLRPDTRYRQATDAVTICRLIVRTQLQEYLVAIPAHLVRLRMRWNGAFQRYALSHFRALVLQWLYETCSVKHRTVIFLFLYFMIIIIFYVFTFFILFCISYTISYTSGIPFSPTDCCLSVCVIIVGYMRIDVCVMAIIMANKPFLLLILLLFFF